MNRKCDRYELGCGKSHICVIETTSFQRDDFTTHVLHLNSRYKKKLTRLITKFIGDKMCQGLAVFLLSPVQEPTIFYLKRKVQMCLKCIYCNYLDFRNQDTTIDSSNSLLVSNKNIRGLRNKTKELMNSLENDNISRHVQCLVNIIYRNITCHISRC